MAIYAHLGLKVVSRDDVADGAQRRGLHSRGGVDEQLHQALADTGLDNGLDFVVLAIGEVAQGPARVRQDLPQSAARKSDDCQVVYIVKFKTHGKTKCDTHKPFIIIL